MPVTPAAGRSARASNLQPQFADVSSALLGPIEDFRTAAAINHALGRLYVLLAGNRIAPRQAAVLAYISQLMLQSLSDVKEEVNRTYSYGEVSDAIGRILDASSPLRKKPSRPKRRN